MTTTIDPTEVEIGTFWWVRNLTPLGNGDSPPEMLGVRLNGLRPWMVLYPQETGAGWPIDDVIVAEHPIIAPYQHTHRGWWTDEVEVLRPREEEPVIESTYSTLMRDELAKVREELRHVQAALTETRELLRQANERTANQLHAMERFKERVVEVGGQYAERNDWCSTYDEIMEELGLPGREREWTISVRCSYDTEVVVTARSESDARDLVGEAGTVWNFNPPSMIEGFRTIGASNVDYEVDDQ